MRMTPTFLDGATLALAALPDVDAVVDTHRCELERAYKLDVVHDHRSRLTGQGPYTRDRRIFAVRWDHARDATGTEDELRALVLDVASRHPGRPILLLRGLVSMLVHTDLQGVAASLAGVVPNPLRVIEQRGTDDDWTEGWSAIHDAVHALVLRDDGDREPVVSGFAMARQEGDEAGNVAEVVRLLEAAGAVGARWPLSGSPVGSLRVHPGAPRIRFPHGGPAPADLAPDPVCTDLPYGYEATARMVRAVGAVFGGADAAERLLEAGRASLRERLEPVVTRCLAGRAAVVIEEPYRAAGLVAALRELSVEVPWAVLLRRRGVPCAVADSLAAGGVEVLRDPEYAEVRERLASDASAGRADVVIGSGAFADAVADAGLPSVETGFPFYIEHFAASMPFMGLEGLPRLADRVANAITRSSHRASS